MHQLLTYLFHYIIPNVSSHSPTCSIVGYGLHTPIFPYFPIPLPLYYSPLTALLPYSLVPIFPSHCIIPLFLYAPKKRTLLVGGTAFPWFSVDVVPVSLNADRSLLDGVPVAATPCRPAQV